MSQEETYVTCPFCGDENMIQIMIDGQVDTASCNACGAVDPINIMIEYEDGHRKEVWVDTREVTVPDPDDDDDEELRDWLAQHHDNEVEGGHGVVLYWEHIQ